MSLVLNFSRIRFDDHEIRIGRLPYGCGGEHVLKQLREEHNGTHVFRREGRDSIFAVPVTADAPWIGTPETIGLKEHLSLAAALIRNRLLTYVAGLRTARIIEGKLRTSNSVFSQRCILRPRFACSPFADYVQHPLVPTFSG